MEWWTLARVQSGVISRNQLIAHGLPPSRVDRMLAAGHLEPAAAGVFLVRGAPLTYHARLWVATLSTNGVLGFATAAELWGVTEVRSRSLDSVVHTVVPHARRIYPPAWVRVHRVPISPRHIVVRDELPITSLPWTLCDYLPTLTASDATKLADRAIQRQWFTAEDMSRRVRDYPHRRGNPRLKSLIAITSDRAAANSERRLHALLRQAKIVGWVPNYPVWVDGELRAVLDLAFPACQLSIEVDGMAYHTDPDRFQRDRSRQNEVQLLGWLVLRFTWADLMYRPERVIQEIRRAIRGVSAAPRVGNTPGIA